MKNITVIIDFLYTPLFKKTNNHFLDFQFD